MCAMCLCVSKKYTYVLLLKSSKPTILKERVLKTTGKRLGIFFIF